MVTFLEHTGIDLEKEILEGISAGLKDIEKGNVFTLEESKKRIDKIING